MEAQKNMPSTVGEYIVGFPAPVAARMEDMRKAIHASAQGVNEKISWGMATFYKGKGRVHFAGHKNHIGFYPGVEPIAVFGHELAPYKTSKGGIQFPYLAPLPLDLIGRIAAYALKGE